MNSVISELMAVSVGHTCNLVNLVLYDFHLMPCHHLTQFPGRAHAPRRLGSWRSRSCDRPEFYTHYTFTPAKAQRVIYKKKIRRGKKKVSDDGVDIAGIFHLKQACRLSVLISVC